MTDKELLELAAKAAGIECNYWNPLIDDGEALRLAVTMNLSMDLFDNEILVGYTPNCNDCEQVVEPVDTNPYAATRRAIVRAVAEIGEGVRPFPTVEEIEQLANMDDKPEWMK